MATSERKLAANRANAKRSTGPRTAKGKRRSSRNAIIHGLTARSAVLHGDDAREFNTFAGRIVDELDPDGAMQVQLTEEIINYSWRLRRVPRAEQLLFVKHHTFYKPDPDESDHAEMLEVTLDEDEDEDDVELERVPVEALSAMIQDKSWGGKPRSPVLILDRYAARLERARASALRLLLALQKRKPRDDEEESLEEATLGARDDDPATLPAHAGPPLDFDDVSRVAADVSPAHSTDADVTQVPQQTLTPQNEPTGSPPSGVPEVTVFNVDTINESPEIEPPGPGTEPTAEPFPNPAFPVEPNAPIGESPPATT